MVRGEGGVTGEEMAVATKGFIQRREAMTSRRSDNLYALITFQGQESWMQVTRIALWTKSQRAHGVFY